MTLRSPSIRDDNSAYLEAAIGPFRLALGANSVVTILGDVAVADTVSALGESLPFVDLRKLFLESPRPLVPFAVVLESTAGRAVVGVDKVDHLRLKSTTPLLPLPKLGLEAPGILAGALRDSRGLLIELEPAALTLFSQRGTGRLTPFGAKGIQEPMRSSGEVIDSPRPVMTFRVAGEWVAIPVEQVGRIAQTARLWPLPLSFPQHLGLLDEGGELIPVFGLGAVASAANTRGDERLVAILQVRGESVGLAVEAAGKVYHGFHSATAERVPPSSLASIGAQSIVSGDSHAWLIDPDQLWQELRVTGSP